MLRRCLAPALLTCLGISIQTSAVLGADWSFDAQRMALEVNAGAQQIEAVRGIRFVAPSPEGPMVFETAGVAKVEPVRQDVQKVTFRLTGPAAHQASVTCEVDRSTALRVRLGWRIAYSGPRRAFSPWATGLQLTFPDRPAGARCKPMVRWTVPDGRYPWQVAGDTPYAELDRYLRVIQFGSRPLVLATSWYDPNWFYAHDLGRVSFLRLAIPEKPAQEVQGTVEIIPDCAGRSDAELLTLAAGQPVSVEVDTGATCNLFAPGQPLRLHVRCRNVSLKTQVAGWAWSVHDYEGKTLVEGKQRLDLAPGAEFSRDLLRGIEAAPGIYFVAGELTWPGGRRLVRTTLGVLATRKSELRPLSPFGVAGIICNPEVYPDQPEMDTVLGLCARIGVHWIRGLGFPIRADVPAGEVARARARLGLLRRHGILPHVQCGQGVPADENASRSFARDFQRSLSSFAFLSPYVEVGNELNSVMKADDYVKRLLKPQYQATRNAAPASKVVTMGLAGVDKIFWDGFVAAAGLDFCDVISVHPGHYPRAPEYWEGWDGWVWRPQLARVFNTLKERGIEGKREVWVTEAYAPALPERSQLDLRTAADYLVREYCLSLALGVRVVEWYQLQDGAWYSMAPDPLDIETGFGMVYTDLAPKPQCIAYGVMTAQLEGSKCLGRLDLGADDLYGIRFQRGGEIVDVLWSYREKHECDLPWWPPEVFKGKGRQPKEPWQPRWLKPVEITLPARGEVTQSDLMGRSRCPKVRESRVSLALTGSPIYVRGLGTIPVSQRVWPKQ